MKTDEIKTKVRLELVRVGCKKAAELTGRSQQQMSDYARGTKNMSLEQAFEIGKLLGLFDAINID